MSASPGVQALGKLLRALTRWVWVVFVIVLMLLGVLGLVSWKTLLVVGVVGGAIVVLSPVVFGAVLAVDSWRQKTR